jgi:hypothetical protein
VKIISDFCGRWFSPFAFGGVVAGLVTWVGTRDLENYDYAVFSLDRGTAVEFVRVLGQPVYTWPSASASACRFTAISLHLPRLHSRRSSLCQPRTG